jgi:phospholipid/cholesterol/gamma-HCH transport system ATP-binding protein
LPTPAAQEAHVALAGVRVGFAERSVFDGLEVAFERGRISVIMGPSGCGKSTLLRLIGGLQAPDAGSVKVAGEELVGLGEIGLGRARRRLGMQFQNGALLDSMSVFDNIALPLREHGRGDAGEIADRVRATLDAVGLDRVEGLLPRELSGGMLRRVAFARAIVMEPEILLCDEPFSGLDPPNVERIESLLVELSQRLGLTVLVTSHHMASSLRMGDRIVLLRGGRALVGTPRELAESRDSEIRNFMGADAAAFLAGLEAPTPGATGDAR